MVNSFKHVHGRMFVKITNIVSVYHPNCGDFRVELLSGRH